MRLLLIALMSVLLTAAEAWAGDPVPGIGIVLEHNAARPGETMGDRPSTRVEAVTDREGIATIICGTLCAHSGGDGVTLFVTPTFEGAAILRVEGRDISVPIRGQGRGAEPVRAATFEVRRGERVRVQLERPDRR